jgi:hypothetical protein
MPGEGVFFAPGRKTRSALDANPVNENDGDARSPLKGFRRRRRTGGQDEDAVTPLVGG